MIDSTPVRIAQIHTMEPRRGVPARRDTRPRDQPDEDRSVTDPPRLAPAVVAHPGALDALASALSEERVVALDTESNSFHVYRERVCLIQISTPAGDWVVDPFAVDPRPPGPILSRIPV